MTSRRNFIKNGTISGLATVAISPLAFAADTNVSEIKITIKNYLKGKIYKPLQKLNISLSAKATFSVCDGKGNEYARFNNVQEAEFTIGGSLGVHQILVEDTQGKIIQNMPFKVDTATEITDEKGVFSELNTITHWSMIGRAPGMDGGGGLAAPFLVDGKFHYFFVPWLRDHVHTLKGMKYYFADIKPAIELFAKYQREDGMIADNVYGSSKDQNMWDKRFGKGGFIWRTPDYKFEFKRIPAEADMEYLFIEGLYYTWKATGDTNWMSNWVENAIKAIKYCTSDPYRWSEKYGLVKRGYTIDTWDFQSNFHIEDTGKDIMVIDKDKTKFGIMHGDITGTIASLRYLAEMLDALDRKSDAESMRAKATDFQQKLDKLAWNGNFYTHHVPEDPSFKPDFGVDTSTQVSLSNAYAINRGITHEQSVKIIETYKRIAKEKPVSSPAEWFAIYPPFKNGFDGELWSYMNGGVISIVAGELAKGAFENGYETYGVDILTRILAQAKENNNYIYGCYKGQMPSKPVNQKTQIIDLKPFANADTYGKGAENVPGWSGEGENDLHEMPSGLQTYFDIPFQVVDPGVNARKAVLGISNVAGYSQKTVIPVGSAQKSVYLLHIKAGNGLAGKLSFVYSDGTEATEEIDDSRITGWWMPTDKPNFKLAWKGKNEKAPMVGVGVCGINNPNPQKTIKEIVLKSADGTKCKWMILGITLSDSEVYLKPNPLSTGIPDKWGAAAIMYALAEGLSGIKDTGLEYSSVTLSPRWAATNQSKASATLKYEASGGYCSYDYSASASEVKMQISSSAEKIKLRILLPEGKKAASLTINGKKMPFITETIEKSVYSVSELEKGGLNMVVLGLV
jgi:hypothetical protein